MPQLDVASYLTQYIWMLVALLLLFFVVVLRVLPGLQQQLILRAWAEGKFKSKRREDLVKEGRSYFILNKVLTEIKK